MSVKPLPNVRGILSDTEISPCLSQEILTAIYAPLSVTDLNSQEIA